MMIPRRPTIEAAALVIGGSGGNEPTYIAEALAREGIAALSVAYFGTSGLPPDLAEIDLAYFESALALLATHAGVRIPTTLVGQSRGSEAAILTALHFGDLVDGVVVTVPSNVSVCGFPSGGPAWMLDRTPCPFSDDFGPTSTVPEAIFEVERIAAPMLFVSAGSDEVWPSAQMARAMAARRRHSRRSSHDLLLEYPAATHALGYLCPDLPHGLVRSSAGDPVATQAARMDAWPQVLGFIAEVAQARRRDDQ